MNFVSDIPIYIQIAEEFELRIIIGTYKSGEKLPTIRVLAEEMGVNINTIQRALFEVNKLGIINLGKGNVRYVTNDIMAINKTFFINKE